jgi:hypothetical protein
LVEVMDRFSAVAKLSGDTGVGMAEQTRVDTRCVNMTRPRTWDAVKDCRVELWLEAAGDGGFDGGG